MYRIIILPVVLYESLTLREEYKLRSLENRFLRKVFSSAGMELTRVLIKLQNKAFRNFLLTKYHYNTEVKESAVGKDQLMSSYFSFPL